MVGEFANPVPPGRRAEIVSGGGQSFAIQVGPLRDGAETMAAASENCRGAGCPQNFIELGQHWVFLPITVWNNGPDPLDVGGLYFSLYGAEGIEREGRSSCGDENEGQTVLPGAVVAYVRCFAVSDADLKASTALASFWARVGEDQFLDETWLISSATDL